MLTVVVPVGQTVTTALGTASTSAFWVFTPNTSKAIAGNIAATLTALLTISLPL